MKQLFTIIFTIIFCLQLCIAQTTDKPRVNAISFELGKTGLIYNFNFDRKVPDKQVGFRFGAGSNFAKYLNAFTVGGGGYYLIGRKNNFLELGADLQYLIVDEVSDDQRGFSFIYPDYSIKTLYPSVNVGYRYYGKMTLFRVGVAPALIKREFVPGGYISYGFLF